VHKVKLAISAGFCFGVERAVKLAVSALEEFGRPVYTLGPIIHNPQEVLRLQDMGIEMARSLEDIGEGTVVIRSHGAPKGVIEQALRKNLNVVDATCPLVQRLRERVRELADEGYQVLIVGESDHPEVKAVSSFAPHSCLVVRDPAVLDPEKLKKKVGIVAQTTQSLKNLRDVTSLCVCHCSVVKTYNTICQATHKRVAEALQLANEVDMMIVVGGKNSANTTRLAESVSRGGKKTYHIESASDLAEIEIPHGVPIGVTAGASTPGWVIEEVVSVLRRMD